MISFKIYFDNFRNDQIWHPEIANFRAKDNLRGNTISRRSSSFNNLISSKHGIQSRIRDAYVISCNFLKAELLALLMPWPWRRLSLGKYFFICIFLVTIVFLNWKILVSANCFIFFTRLQRELCFSSACMYDDVIDSAFGNANCF